MADTLIETRLEKAVAGGRSLARVDGRIVLVSGGVPGEQVRIAVERTGKGVAFGRVVEVIEPSPDRIDPAGDPQCGGLAFAHVAYPAQLALKRAILEDALRRIGRFGDLPDIETVASPSTEWRLRARLHVERGRVGFFREGTHTLCDAGPSGQLVPGLLEAASGVVARLRPQFAGMVEAIVISQAVSGEETAAHLELRRPLPRHGEVWQDGGIDGLALTGVSAGLSTSRQHATLAGHPWIGERLLTLGAAEGTAATGVLQRHAAAFFQGNRALIPVLVARVIEAVGGADAPLFDLYAGVGLFGIAAAAAAPAVTCVEGDAVSAEDLVANARQAGPHVQAVRGDVESFAAREGRTMTDAGIVVDPPRTGLAPTVVTALVAARPRRVVYVSCDPATLARDLQALVAGGLQIERMAVVDLFPVTAHVETVVTLSGQG
jgi:23S rRNA (uracil1939-C5)-methyltransferase